MTLGLIFACALLALATLPALMTLRNIDLFCVLDPVPSDSANDAPLVSVLIPARDEQAGIADALRSVLRSSYSNIEVLVLDDHSTDRTAEIVTQIADEDSRVRLHSSSELPDGWNGKQFACHQLAKLCQGELLLFMDADVRLSVDAIAALVTRIQCTPDVGLLSGFPNQETVTVSENLLIPLMHLVLLGYLPLDQMRQSDDPRFGAGCGQLFLARRDAYFTAGGHEAISESRHDGLKLPRAFRAAGIQTDLVDASKIATVRMYDSWPAVRRGLLKNANEGIARWPLILIFSILLLGGLVMPVAMLGHALFWGWSWLSIAVLSVATILSYLPRAVIALRLRQSLLGVLLNPLAVAIFVFLQWFAFTRDCLGLGPVTWRGRPS